MAKLDKNKQMILIVSFVLIFLLVVFVFSGGKEAEQSSELQTNNATPIAAQSPTGGVEIGSLAPTAEFQSQNGPINISDYKGQPLLVEFMSVECPYCKKLAPTLERVSASYPDVKVLLVGIPGQTVAGVEAWNRQKQGGRADVAVDSKKQGVDNYRLIGTPTLVWIDGDGKVVFYQTGVASAEALQKQFSRLSQ